MPVLAAARRGLSQVRQGLARLVDHLGRPFNEGALRREHARPAGRGARAWTYASVASGLTPSRLAAIFTAADTGDNTELLTLAADLERRDSHAGAQVRTRKLALAGLPWQIEAATDKRRDRKDAEEVQALISRPEFTFLVINLMDACLKGYSVAEIEWQRGARWVPNNFIWRDPRHFALDKEDGTTLRLRTEAQPRDGEDLPAFKFITHAPLMFSGPVATAGLIRPLSIMYSVKTLGVGAWLAYMEIFGVPTRLGRYEPGVASEDDIEALEKAVQMIGLDGAGVMPRTTEIELLDAVGKGNGTGEHERLTKWADEQVSKAVLGQTMTADSGASLSQAQIHQLVRRDILLADALMATATLQRDLVQVYIDINYGPRDPADYPKIRCLTEEPEDRKAFVDALVPLVDRGLKVEQSVVRDKMGLPEPDEGAAPEDFLRPLGKQVGAGGAGDDVGAGSGGDGLDQAPEVDELEENATARRALTKWFDSIEPERAAAAGDGEDFIDRESDPDAGTEEPALEAVRQAAAESASYTEFMAALRSKEIDADDLVKGLALRTLQARGMGDATDEVE